MKCHSLFRKYLQFQITFTILTEKVTSFAVCLINSAVTDTGNEERCRFNAWKILYKYAWFLFYTTGHPDIKFKSNLNVNRNSIIKLDITI